jgi:hypothetical protein
MMRFLICNLSLLLAAAAAALASANRRVLLGGGQNAGKVIWTRNSQIRSLCLDLIELSG